MQPSTGHARRRRSGPLSLLLALALTLAAGCSDSTGPTGPTTPSFRVSVTTTGADLDPDGYVLAIISNAGTADQRTITRSVGINDTIVVSDVPAGEQLVYLRVAANCTFRYPAPWFTVARITPAAGGSPPSLAFSVSCVTRSSPPALAATELLFVRSEQIYRTRVDGTGLVALGSGSFPAWSPDGQHIAFARGSDFYVMHADGSELVALGSDQFPVWSPDGQRIAFSRDGQIYRARADGTGLVALGPGYFPAWSPDGQRIAFARGSDFYVMDTDGANAQRVAAGNPGYVGGWSTWSPDGRRIAFTSADPRYEDGPAQITVVALDGASAPIVIPDSYSPVWSPDGSRIAFESPNPRWVAGAGVWTVAPDGSDRRLLTQRYLSGFAWSPDGKQLALAGDDGIAVVNANASGLRQLTTIGGSQPMWSPDGQAIAFVPRCWSGDCTRSVFYVTADGSTTGLLIENAWLSSWRR